MGIFTKVALRNAVRHFNRNILIGSSIALAVGLFFLILSVSAGIEKQLIGNLVQIETGVVSFSLRDEDVKGESQIDRSRLNSLYSQIREVSEVSGIRERIQSRALLNSGNKSADINLRGVDWSKENALYSSLRFEHNKSNDSLRTAGILISQHIADKLGVTKNDYCSVLVQTVHGSLNLEEYKVSGVYRNISGWANTMVFINMPEIQTLINTDLPSHVLIDSKNLEAATNILGTVAKLLRFELNDTLDIESYIGRSSMASTIANANKYGFLSIVFFLQIISFFGIGFVVHNNIMERKKEIGTLLAIGFKPRRLQFSFLFETFLIAVVSSLLGLLVFGSITAYYANQGIFLGDTATLVFGSSILKPFSHFPNLLLAFAIGLVYPLLSALWSVRKIRKADPIQLIYDR